MATVKSKWQFNDTLTDFPTGTYNVNFTSAPNFIYGTTNYTALYKTDNTNGIALNYKEATTGDAISTYSFNEGKWADNNFKTVDFGETEQTVNDGFYNWLVKNAKQIPEQWQIQIKYGDSLLGYVTKGQTATLYCEDKKMLHDVVVSFVEAGTITYNGEETPVNAGETATLHCGGYKMLSDIVIYAKSEVVGETAGLYDVNGDIVATWDTLVNTYGMNVSKNYTTSSYQTDTESPYYVFTNNAGLSDGVKIVILNSITSIGNSAFMYCRSLTSTIIPDSVTSIGNYAFYHCSSLTSVIIPNSVTVIGAYAFHSCSSLKIVIIDNSVTSISYAAFYDCSSLESVDMGDYIKTISGYAFAGCRSLTSITIPDSVTSIGDRAFYNCIGLTSITIKATQPPTLSSATIFPTSNTEFAIYVPRGYGDIYRNHSTNWSNLASYIQEKDL